MSNVLKFLTTSEGVRFSLCSKQLYTNCSKVEYLRVRRREVLAAMTADQSKAKKLEKKKKIKQANVKKESKKDAFARGGNS